MKIEQLEQAVKIAELNSISLAAEELFISQPNLSLSIRKLEQELGYPIFLRTNKGVNPTPLGQNFIDSAKIILMQFHELQKLGANLAMKDQRSFSIAHMHYRYVNHAIAQLFASRGNLRLEVREGLRNTVIDLVERRVCELGLIGMYSHYHKMTLRRLEIRGLQYFRLCSSPVSVIVGRAVRCIPPLPRRRRYPSRKSRITLSPFTTSPSPSRIPPFWRRWDWISRSAALW